MYGVKVTNCRGTSSDTMYQTRKPIDVAAQFGEHPDIDEVDAHVRSVMQTALDRLGRQRRFPVLG